MHLVIQGADIETCDLKELAKLSGATAIDRLGATAFRLSGAQPAAGIAELCAGAKLDFGFVPEGRKLTDFRLLVMDMDSTLITMETIDELADMVNIKAAVAAITERAMRGEIEYDQSLRERLALLKGLDESALLRVYEERLKFSPGAERMLAAVQAAGIKTLLVSGGFTYMTDRLKTRVRLDYTHSNVLEITGGKLTGKVIGEIVNADAKLAALKRIANEIGASPAQIAGGDGGVTLEADGRIPKLGGNFLVRTRQQYVERGFTTLVIDAPSDKQSPPYLSGSRQTAEHVADVKAVIAWLREQAKIPVWLIGTSRGTQSVAYIATQLPQAEGGPDGIVLTSSIVRDQRSRAVPEMALDRIRIPVLVAHHRDDGCRVCLFADVPPLLERLTAAPRKELIAFDGGISVGDPCEARAYHGFNGIEREVIERIATWIAP